MAVRTWILVTTTVPSSLKPSASDRGLAALKALLADGLARERGQPPPSDGRWCEEPGEELLAAIQRQRLVCVLQADPVLAERRPLLQPRLTQMARQEIRRALALVSLTRQIARLFDQAAIPMLVLKGIPLALQTTGSPVGRGGGDLDVWVDARQLPQAVALLHHSGFAVSGGASPHADASLFGRYSRWVDYELSLNRQQPHEREWIDLHWRLSCVNEGLPSFAEAYRDRQILLINQLPVATLNPTTAFVHACAHAAKDNWLYLRNLVDVERLARPLSVAQRQQLRRHKLVRWSSLVSHAATAAPHLLPLCETLPPSARARLERQAEHFQRLRARSLGPDGWTIGSRLRSAFHILALSKRPADWFPQLVRNLIPPADLIDVQTGTYRSIPHLVRWRCAKLSRRLSDTNRR